MNQKEKSPKRKMTHRQAAAILGIAALILLYVVTFIMAIVDKSDSAHLFYVCLFATFAIPLITWIYIWIYGRLTGKPTITDPKPEDTAQAEASSSAPQDSH